jgi:hypothetical protein
LKINNRILSSYPEICKEAYGFDVSDKFANSHEKISWKCKKGHIWVEKIINRTDNNVNCPKCEKR